MAGVEFNLIAAVMAALKADATVTGLVAAANIDMKSTPYPASYPAITLSPAGSRGDDFPATWDGLLYVRMYHQGSQPYTNLDAIHDAVKYVLDAADSHSEVSTASVTFHNLYEVACSEPIVEIESPISEVYSLNSHYRVTVTDET